MAKPPQAFWEQPLNKLNSKQWEALCDGCGQCCLIKLQDDETEQIFATDVVCRFYKKGSGKCRVYPQRTIKKPDCFVIERDNAEHFSWLPKTCAYRLRYENKPLKSWHPLICSSREDMIDAGVAVSNWSVSEVTIDESELEDRIIFSLEEEE